MKTVAGIADPGPQLGSPTQAKRVEKREGGEDVIWNNALRRA